MSIKAMSYVWEHSCAKGSELLLLLAIADHADDDGYCWPTIGTLAHKIRLDKRSVMRLVQALENRGELYVVRSNRNNRYIVVMGQSQVAIERILELRQEDASGDAGVASIGDNLSRDILSRDTHVTSIGDTGVTSIGDTGVTLIINEPSCNHHEREKEKYTDKEKETPNNSADATLGNEFVAIIDRWAELFPTRPHPTAANKALRRKAFIRLKDDDFRENWEQALQRMTHASPFVSDGTWFTLNWFLANDENWRKCADGNYDDRNARSSGVVRLGR